MIGKNILRALVLPAAFMLSPAQAALIGGFDVSATATYGGQTGTLGTNTGSVPGSAGGSVDTYVYATLDDSPVLTLNFGRDELVNGAGDDLVLFEIGTAEAFSSLRITGLLITTGLEYTVDVLTSLMPTGTGNTISGSAPIGPAESQNLNALTVDIGALGLSSATSLELGLSLSDGAEFALAGALAPVPVPAAVWLFGSGLLGLVGIARRKK